MAAQLTTYLAAGHPTALGMSQTCTCCWRASVPRRLPASVSAAPCGLEVNPRSWPATIMQTRVLRHFAISFASFPPS